MVTGAPGTFLRTQAAARLMAARTAASKLCERGLASVVSVCARFLQQVLETSL